MPHVASKITTRLAAAPATARLFLAIRQNLYTVDPVACEGSDPTRAYRLRKPDGTLYDVSQTEHGPRCDCPDFIFRRDGLDPTGCKHVKALVAHGMIAANP